jgi:adenosylcobinamide-GDP ribazoletransferase
VLTATGVFKFLILAGPTEEVPFQRFDFIVLCFPLLGLALGFGLVIINRIAAPYLPTEILAVVLVTLLILATAGHQLAGTQSTFASLPIIQSLESAVDRRHTFGLLAVLLVVIFKIHALAAMGESRASSLLLTPLFARWSLLLFLFSFEAFEDKAARSLVAGVRPWNLLVASAATVSIALFVAGVPALWVAFSLSLLALLARTFMMRRAIGVSLACCGALIEVSEALGFALFASL